jgi:hypothetical protein
LLKIYFAVSNPGFYSGDDVEIHEMTLGHLLGQRAAVARYWHDRDERAADVQIDFSFTNVVSLFGNGCR